MREARVTNINIEKKRGWPRIAEAVIHVRFDEERSRIQRSQIVSISPAGTEFDNLDLLNAPGVIIEFLKRQPIEDNPLKQLKKEIIYNPGQRSREFVEEANKKVRRRLSRGSRCRRSSHNPDKCYKGPGCPAIRMKQVFQSVNTRHRSEQSVQGRGLKRVYRLSIISNASTEEETKKAFIQNKQVTQAA